MAVAQKKQSLTGLGLAFGIVAGLFSAAILFSATQDPIYYVLVAIGAMFGLVIGTVLDRKERAG